jgi:nucleoside-diphosphate-sugar epimerase
MRILLTGHKGFIGSYLHSELSQHHKVYGIDLKSGDDIFSVDYASYDVDLVIHLAGKSGVRESLKLPGPYWHVNVEGSKRILDHFSRRGIRVLYASSSSAYEPSLNPYAASKFLVEEHAKRYNNVLGMRFHTVYSDDPRQGMFLQLLKDNQLKYITNHSRDFIHINDLIDGIKIIINSDLKGIVDIGTGRSVKISELVEGIPVKFTTPHERQCTKANIGPLRLLGFNPQNKVEDVVKRFGNKVLDYNTDRI